MGHRDAGPWLPIRQVVDAEGPASGEAEATLAQRLFLGKRPRAAPAALLLAALAAVSLCWALSPRHGLPNKAQPRGQGVEAKAAVWSYMPSGAEAEKCGDLDDNTDYTGGKLIEAIKEVHSASMCCSACAAYPKCRAWTWGKNYSVPYVGGYCFVKEFASLDKVKKETNRWLMSGTPHPGVKKYGIIPSPASVIAKREGVTPKDVGGKAKITPTCPGKLNVTGLGPVTLVNADKSVVEVLEGDAVVSHMHARTYWGDWCTEGVHNNNQYAVIYPLGKTIRYTTDVSGTGCGCNAAFYLVAMRQNYKVGTCGDFYCDVMSVCGVPCLEIDLQEANQYAWRSTLHAKGDLGGQARGYSGSQASPARRDWTSKEYGPGGECVDSSKPFQVAISFPLDPTTGELAAFEVELSQDGKACPLKTNMTSYSWGWPPPRKEGWSEVTRALRAGLTPVMSYWRSEGMLWMDGLGQDGRGPCVKDTPSACPEYVRFYNFSLEEYTGSARPSLLEFMAAPGS
mmetsp:Transcript_141486/g.439808  ORF Transcript_141486/g.439808 Transcript_141486/m.439808 type:complete len:511 (+) Transcript_141486:56-1588(+)